MALLGFFRPREEEEGEPVLRDRSTILAYIEELIRVRAGIQLWVHKDDLVPLTGKLDALNEDARTMTVALQRAVPGEVAAQTVMDMVFHMEGMRFVTPVRFTRRDGYLKATFTIPESVRHAERRGKMRARFGPREKATVTVLQGFFEGHGATGRLVNLSLEGLCMRIDRAISIGDDRKLGLSPALFEPGTSLPVVRIQNLPHTPMIECSAMVAHIDATPIGVLLGLRLDGLSGLDLQVLEMVLTRRLPRFSKGFPVRRRRAELESELALNNPESQEEWSEDVPEEEPQSEVEEVSPEVSEIELKAARVDPHERLLQIKKRGKRILLVMLDDLDRAILAGTLQVDGFRQVLEARSFVEALGYCKLAPLDLILIEQQVGTHNAPQFLERLRKQGGCEEVPVIMITDTPDVRATIMAKGARIAHVQKRPVDYDGEMKGILAHLLALE